MLTRLLFWILSRAGRDSRGLFLFYDGRRWRTVDGMETLRGFFNLEGFDWDNTPAKMNQGIAVVQLAVHKEIADAVRKVFGIKTVADGGLSETRCVELFNEFRDYCDNVKKNGSLFLISATAEDGKQSENFVIPPSLPSASTSTTSDQSPDNAGSTAGAT